jgi:hypothetical protein
MMKRKEEHMTERKETSEIVSKMVYALSKKNKDYAIGYLETFISNLINDHVKDPVELEFLRLRMLTIGIDQLIDTKKIG